MPSSVVSDDPRLTEVARELVRPKGIVSSGWPAVAAVCGRLGLGFDAWQSGLGSLILGKRADGEYAADTVAISIPRQVGKTYLIGAIVFALCLIRPGLLVLWTAHRYKTARETYEAMRSLAGRRRVKRHIRSTPSGEGNQAVIFRNGSRILFGARERGFGRGMSKVGVVVFDECQILGDRAVDDMVPATARAENPLILNLGTPPKPEDPGEHFTNLRKAALDGEDEGTLYVEFGADPDADPNDRAQWRKANPSFPRHTSERAMLRVKKNLSPEAWLLEGLGIWPGDGPSIMPKWARFGSTKVRAKRPERLVLGIAGSVDGKYGSIGAAGVDAKGHLVVGAVERREGQSWLVDEAKRIQDVYGYRVAVTGGPLSDLMSSLDDAGVDYTDLTSSEYMDACASLWRAVEQDKTLRHPKHPDLDKAVRAASWHKVGDRRRFARQTGDISMLEAVTVAASLAVDEYDPLDSVL